MRSTGAARRTRGAFTLMELLIVIGILALLAGLSVTAGTALFTRAEVQTTNATIQLLDMALGEWETLSDRKLTFGSLENADIWEDREFTLVLPELLRVVRRNPESAIMLGKIRPALIHEFKAGEIPEWFAANPYTTPQLDEFTGAVTVLDAWGSPIYATHPGERAAPGEPADDDGTEVTFNETVYGHARNRRVCFISAGPDRRFGLPDEFPFLQGGERAEAMILARRDNLASYAPLFPPIPSGNSGPGEAPSE